jgi:hypothetical protein
MNCGKAAFAVACKGFSVIGCRRQRSIVLPRLPWPFDLDETKGEEVISALKDDPEVADIPGVMVSIIDDDEHIRELLRRLLDQEG